jgi:hypothetical protein
VLGFLCDVNSVLGLLYSMVFADISDVSEVYSASIFKVEVCRIVTFRININDYPPRKPKISKFYTL